MTEEWDDIRKILFVLLEAFSHNPNLLLHEKQRSIVIRSLLPSLIQWLDATNGNIRVLCMKISCDILITVFHAIGGKFELRLSQKHMMSCLGAMKFIGEKLLPLYKMIVKQEEPVPQYALKFYARPSISTARTCTLYFKTICFVM